MANVTSLCIKLRISNPHDAAAAEQEEEEERDVEGSKEEKIQSVSRVCHVCNKRFSSGKSLGGHMGMHAKRTTSKDTTTSKNEPSKNKKMKKNVWSLPVRNGPDSDQLNATTTTTASDNVNRSIECKLCKKTFISRKSLYGHMRSHPERSWRGIDPPVSAADKQSSSSTFSDHKPTPMSQFKLDFDPKSHDGDLSRVLPGWSVTAKRGRRSISSTSDYDAASVSDDKMQDGVYELMLLANSTLPSSDQASNNEMKIKFSGITYSDDCIGTSNSQSKKRKIDDVTIVELRRNKEKTLAETLESEEMKCENGICRADQKAVKRKKGKKVKILDLENINDSNLSHVCSICDKRYSTYQALGGHMSSHKKGKNAKTREEEAPMAEVEGKLINGTATENGEETRREGGRRGLDIDLNELPAMEDDDDHHHHH